MNISATEPCQLQVDNAGAAAAHAKQQLVCMCVCVRRHNAGASVTTHKRQGQRGTVLVLVYRLQGNGHLRRNQGIQGLCRLAANLKVSICPRGVNLKVTRGHCEQVGVHRSCECCGFCLSVPGTVPVSLPTTADHPPAPLGGLGPTSFTWD